MSNHKVMLLKNYVNFDHQNDHILFLIPILFCHGPIERFWLCQTVIFLNIYKNENWWYFLCKALQGIESESRHFPKANNCYQWIRPCTCDKDSLRTSSPVFLLSVCFICIFSLFLRNYSEAILTNNQSLITLYSRRGPSEFYCSPWSKFWCWITRLLDPVQ